MAVILRKALRDSRRSTLWLALGLSAYVLFLMAFYPAMVKQSADMDKLIQSYPKEMLSLMYSGDIEDFSVSDPGTFVQVEFSTWMLLILGAIVIGQAFNAFTNAERDGTMDMLLSLPISRRNLLWGRVVNTVVMLLVVLTASFLAFVLATVLWSEFDVEIGNLALGIYSMIFPLMVIASFTYLLATLVPSSKRFAGALAYLFMVGSYLLHGFSGAVDQLKGIRPLMLFDYYNAGDIIRHGVNITDWLLLGAVTVVYLAGAWWAVERKELSV
jgi:ABC-2 type transport system permease protein